MDLWFLGCLRVHVFCLASLSASAGDLSSGIMPTYIFVPLGHWYNAYIYIFEIGTAHSFIEDGHILKCIVYLL